ncbi:MAG: glycosyltransferase family 4 protein [Phycisphaerales bacterium]
MSRVRFIIPLPQGAAVSGITTWAARLANALAENHDDIQPELLVHRPRPDQSPISLRLHHGVVRHDLEAPPLWEFDESTNRVAATLAAWRAIVREHSDPVVMAPGVHHDAWTVALRLRQESGDAPPTRLLGWLHRDDPYDFAMLEHAAPLVDRFIALTMGAATRLAARLEHRATDLITLPYAVPVPPTVSARPPLAHRTIELLFVGRFDEDQKRLGDLFAIARSLRARAIPFRLRLVGAGPALEFVDEEIRLFNESVDTGEFTIERLAARNAEALSGLYASADALLLTSRVEGLPVTLLEAMAHGVTPLVTAVGGATEIIEDGVNGRLLEVGDIEGFTSAIEELRVIEPTALERRRERARHLVRSNHDLARHAARVAEILRAIVTDRTTRREWPTGRPFTLPPSGVTAEQFDGAVRRLRRLLAALAGAPVAIWGAGRHTVALAATLESYSGSVIILDDDPRRCGERLLDRWTILPPTGATLERHGVREVIISSAFYEAAMYARRSIFGSGTRTHTLYREEFNDAELDTPALTPPAESANGLAPRAVSG